jgi:multicomponent Na+:H+ antiporter subunit G
MIETIGLIFIVTGIAFDFLGVLGLMRLPDVYNRLQAATKCVTFGSIGILFGVLLIHGFSTFGFKALLGIIFLCIASPTAAHAIARAAHRSKVPLAKGTLINQYEEDKELKEVQLSEEKEPV